MKLKALLALTAALAYGGALAQDAAAPAPVAPAITDVPAGHWAKDAVDELVQRRIIIGYPDGTFRGTQNLTRYEAAVMIQRLLQEVAAGRTEIPADLIETLQLAVQELQADLAALGVRVADLEDNGVSRDDFATLEDRVSGFEDNISDLTARLEALEGAEPVEPGETFDPTDLEDRLGALEESQVAQDDQLTDLDGRVAALEELPDVVAGLGDQVAALEELPDVVAGLGDQVAALEESQAAQDDQLADLDGRVAALEESQAVQDEQLGDLDARTVALEESQAAQDDQLSDLDGRLGDAEASLDEVRAALEENTNADGDLQVAIDELTDGLDAAATAADTALTQARELQDALDALTTRTDDLEGQFGDLAADVESNTSSITALNDLTVLLNQDILDLQDQVAALLAQVNDQNAALTGRIDDLSADVDGRFDELQSDIDSRFDGVYEEIDGLRAFDEVIRRDVEVLTGRVTINETSIADLTGRVDGINGRLTTLENNVGFKISGSLSFNYYQSGISGRDFDIDRIIPGTRLSTGNPTNGSGEPLGQPRDYSDFGVRTPIDAGAINGFATATPAANPSIEGKFTAGLSLTVDFANRAISGNSADISGLAAPTSFVQPQQVVGEFGLGDLSGVAASGDSTFPLNFYVKSLSTTLTIGNNPVTIQFGREPKVQFSDYVFDNNKTSRGPGLVLTVDGSSVPGIGGLKPKIIAAYGSTNSNGASDGTGGDFDYYSGVRAEIELSGVTAGLNYAREGGDVSPQGAASNAVSGVTSVFSADLKSTNAFGTGFGVRSEFAQSTTSGSITAANNTTDTAFYVKLNGALGPITLEDLNYRSIDPDYDKAAAISEADPADGDNGSSAPYSKNQTGFGVAANVTLAGFKVRGYYDTKTDYNNLNGASNDDVTRFGVSASGTVGPVAVSGYYDAKSDLGTAAEAPNSGNKYGVNASVGTFAGFTVSAGTDMVVIDGKTVDVDSLKYLSDPGVETNYRFGVSHSGAAADALVKGLNLDASYKASDANFSKSTLTVGGDYTLVAAGFTVKPRARYTTITDSDGVSGFNGVTAATPTDTRNRVDAGVTLTSPTLDAPLRPSLEAQVNYLNTDHTNAAASGGVYNANQLDFRVTARFAEFLLPGGTSTFAASYGSFAGNNRSYTPNFSANGSGSFNDNATAGATTLNGYYLEWNLFDLNLAFGDFTLVGKGETNRAQAFKIAYRVNF